MSPWVAGFAAAVVAASLIAAPGTVNAAAAPPSISWYATGDSFSSGQGVQGNTGACGQSDDAWGPLASRLLSERGTIEVADLVFTACTGRVVSDHFVRNDSGKGSLFEWAKEQGLPQGNRVDLVTMTFGGNDIGFADVLLDCMFWQNPGTAETFVDLMTIPWDDCDVEEEELNERVDALDDDDRFVIDDGGPGGTGERVSGGLRRFYEVTLDRLATPTGHLLVLGYPPIFATSGEWGLWEGRRCQGVTRGDANMLGRIAERFDHMMESQVKAADAGRNRIHYLSVRDLFADGGRSHGLCGKGEQWINGITAAPYVDSFHPTAVGHAGEAAHVAQYLMDPLHIAEWESRDSASTLTLLGSGVGDAVFETPGSATRAQDLLSEAIGTSDDDSGWQAEECTGGTERRVRWEGLTVLLYDDGTGPVLWGWSASREDGDLPEGVSIDLPFDLSATWASMQSHGAALDEFYGAWELGDFHGALAAMPPGSSTPVLSIGAGVSDLYGC